MSDLPGNSHYKGALQFLGWARNGRKPTDWDLTPEAAAYREYGQTQATLALAYEQRTANLFAYWNVMTGDGLWESTPLQRELDGMHKELRTRMGFSAEVPR